MNPRIELSVAFLLVSCASGMADGPADNKPESVRRIPKLGIEVSPQVRADLQAGLDDLKRRADAVNNRNDPSVREWLADILVVHKAVSDALKYQEFFAEAEIAKAKGLLSVAEARVEEVVNRNVTWPSQTGPVARGYVSRIDGSFQPYGVVVPASYTSKGAARFRLDVWFHGRGETLSEVNFLDERSKRPGEFTPEDTIVLHPYGRYCNANKFAGEVDVLEAIEAVKRNYRIDDDRISVRGFSMGGAACWQFAVHYSDRWFAANPGAGFAETAKFLRVFQNEAVKPTWYEQALWHLYDCTDYAVNLSQCPTVAYSGELDNQKQAADVMTEALAESGISLSHVIGPKTKHQYHPESKKEVEAKLKSLAVKGRERFPDEVRFTTYTLKYNKTNWVTIDALEEHWKKARVHARIVGDGVVTVDTENVMAGSLDFPAGFAPFRFNRPVKVILNGVEGTFGGPKSDRSWSMTFARKDAPVDGFRKRHNLQGPIDDAFMDTFLIVKPTGKSPRKTFQSWVDAELPRAIEHWRRHFRGESRVKDDTTVDDADIASSNLILWGDSESNAILKKVTAQLPIAWDESEIKAGDRSFDAAHHALILIYPNPLNPKKYVVLNSGFTFRDYDYLNNARQVPKLPDWAVIDLRTPPDSRYPGKVVAADFFGERWELRTPK